MKINRIIRFWICILILMLTACGPAAEEVTVEPTNPPSPTSSPIPTNHHSHPARLNLQNYRHQPRSQFLLTRPLTAMKLPASNWITPPVGPWTTASGILADIMSSSIPGTGSPVKQSKVSHPERPFCHSP